MTPEDREKAIQAARGLYRKRKGLDDVAALTVRETEALLAGVDAALAALSPAEPVQEGVLQSEEFKAAFEEAQRLIREGDKEGLAALASRGVKARAADAARRARELATDPVRADGIYHVDGALGQIRQMADWAYREAVAAGSPNRETLRKIAANLRASAAALAAEPKPVDRQAVYDRAVDAVFAAKGRELSYTEEAWVGIAVDVALSAALSEARTEDQP